MTTSLQKALRIGLFAALLLWGGYSTLYYLGVSVHQSVLLTDAQRADVMQLCGETEIFCQGLHSLFPSITHTLARMAPLTWYIVLSLVIFGVFLFVRFLNKGDWKISFRFSPLTLLLVFFASLWLQFTVLSSGGGDESVRRMPEPTAQTYPGIGEQSLSALRRNFTDLNDRGCLVQLGTTGAGVNVYEMKVSCIQQSFITRVLSQALFILFILFDLLVLGRALLNLFRRPAPSLPLEAMLSAGLGACAVVAMLWLLAVASVYTTVAGWALLLAIPVLGFRHTLYWINHFWKTKWTFEESRYGLTTLLVWMLLSYLAFNFLSVIRPFPIGWDDLGRYLNQPRLLVSYGQHIPTMAAFYWEYITSLGFLLFGYDSIFAATASMLLNWMAGLLAVGVTYVFGRTFLGRGGGVLAALVYYTLPMVGHFSFADMKIDNAVYFMGALSVLAVFLYLFPLARGSEQDDTEEGGNDAHRWDWRWMVMAGVFGGFAFAMKPTAIMVLMALGAILFGASVHWTAFVGTASIAWAYYTYAGRFSVTEIGTRVYGDAAAISAGMIMAVFGIVGLGFLAYALTKHGSRAKSTFIAAGIFIASFFVSVAPWLLYNNISYGNTFPKLVFTSYNYLSPIFVMHPGEQPPEADPRIKALPADLAVDPNHPYCKGTARVEELDRYWGFRTDWSHYTTLPWRAIMNADSAGYYVTLVPALLLLPLLLLMPAFWTRRGRWMRWLFIATVFMLVQWIFFANGIIWYGLGTFFGLVVAVEYLAAKSPDAGSRSLVGLLIFVSLISAYGHRLWQFEQQRNLLEYPMGKVSADGMRERTIPHYDDIRDIIMDRFESMPDRPYTYRVGTFIPYFIPKNLEVLPNADNQLSMFNCLAQGDDPEVITRRLKALGFNALIFDTNTATIERDPNGTLHQKVERFVNYANDPKSGIKVLIFDPDAGLAFMLIP
jgi:4-amino-4-deoxy-L-arabinose transferase-like glycosyltransferase